MDFNKFACECCGEEKLSEDLRARLTQMREQLDGELPSVAAGYRCAKRAAQAPERDGGPHAEGRAVSFETSSQYRRHGILKAALSCFDEVWIYPARVTVIAPVDHPPYAITVL